MPEANLTLGTVTLFQSYNARLYGHMHYLEPALDFIFDSKSLTHNSELPMRRDRVGQQLFR